MQAILKKRLAEDKVRVEKLLKELKVQVIEAIKMLTPYIEDVQHLC
jgi:hypothetical protein